MDFAKGLLEKYGWKEGQGIGKHLDGIAKPVKASLKFNSDGLGYDQSIEYNNHWWQNAYNDAAKNIQVENASTNGEDVSMKLKNGESIEITTSSYSARKLRKKAKENDGYAGTFVKCQSILDNKIKKSDSDSSDEEADTTSRTGFGQNVLTDEELLKACGGRTAHKGARHGLKLSGKLSRIEEQERQLLEKYENGLDRDEATEVFKGWIEVENKKNKKNKNKIKQTKDVPDGATGDLISPDSEKLSQLLDQTEYTVKYKSKKKKKKHRKIDEQLAESMNSLKATSPEPEPQDEKLRSLNAASTVIKKLTEKVEKKKSEKKSKKQKSNEGGMLSKTASVDEVEYQRKSNKRTREQVIESDDDFTEEITEHRIVKQIKEEMEKQPKKKFKIVAENLTPFQRKHLSKAGLDIVERKPYDGGKAKKARKEEKEFKKIAKTLEMKMSFDDADEVDGQEPQNVSDGIGTSEHIEKRKKKKDKNKKAKRAVENTVHSD